MKNIPAKTVLLATLNTDHNFRSNKFFISSLFYLYRSSTVLDILMSVVRRRKNYVEISPNVPKKYYANR